MFLLKNIFAPEYKHFMMINLKKIFHIIQKILHVIDPRKRTKCMILTFYFSFYTMNVTL